MYRAFPPLFFTGKDESERQCWAARVSKNNAQYCNSRSCRGRKKGGRKSSFSVSDAANTVKGQIGSRSRCIHGPIQQQPVHICESNTQMLNFFLSFWQRIYRVFSDWLSKRNSWVNSNSAPRIVYGHLLLQTYIHHCCLWPSATSETVGLQSHKETSRKAFNLVLFCNCLVSGKVRSAFCMICGKSRETGPIKWRKSHSASCNVFFGLCAVLGPIGIYTLSKI